MSQGGQKDKKVNAGGDWWKGQGGDGIDTRCGFVHTDEVGCSQGSTRHMRGGTQVEMRLDPQPRISHVSEKFGCGITPLYAARFKG